MIAMVIKVTWIKLYWSWLHILQWSPKAWINRNSTMVDMVTSITSNNTGVALATTVSRIKTIIALVTKELRTKGWNVTIGCFPGYHCHKKTCHKQTYVIQT